MTGEYELLRAQARSIFGEERDAVANMANLSALLFTTLKEVNWVGFYLKRGQGLVLGPFQGNPAVSRIAMGSGVCGTAALTKAFQLVPDVCAFPGHIVCDIRSKSELVLPVMNGEDCIGVLDLDSAILARFTSADVDGLTGLLELLALCSDLTQV